MERTSAPADCLTASRTGGGFLKARHQRAPPPYRSRSGCIRLLAGRGRYTTGRVARSPRGIEACRLEANRPNLSRSAVPFGQTPDVRCRPDLPFRAAECQLSWRMLPCSLFRPQMAASPPVWGVQEGVQPAECQLTAFSVNRRAAIAGPGRRAFCLVSGCDDIFPGNHFHVDSNRRSGPCARSYAHSCGLAGDKLSGRYPTSLPSSAGDRCGLSGSRSPPRCTGNQPPPPASGPVRTHSKLQHHSVLGLYGLGRASLPALPESRSFRAPRDDANDHPSRSPDVATRKRPR